MPFRAHLEREDTDSPREISRDTVFLQFAVEDSGRGLSSEEMGALFQRFSQASPKTYGKYGYVFRVFPPSKADNNHSGSGLGLFISREIIELQGGQIGVHSVLDQGTTFFCYVEAQRYRPSKLEIPNNQQRRSSEYDIAQQVKRHKPDILSTGGDSPDGSSGSLDSQDLSIFSTVPSPFGTFDAPKELSEIHGESLTWLALLCEAKRACDPKFH